MIYLYTGFHVTYPKYVICPLKYVMFLQVTYMYHQNMSQHIYTHDICDIMCDISKNRDK